MRLCEIREGVAAEPNEHLSSETWDVAEPNKDLMKIISSQKTLDTIGGPVLYKTPCA